jgi:outer membrane protein assembly factor BamB
MDFFLGGTGSDIAEMLLQPQNNYFEKLSEIDPVFLISQKGTDNYLVYKKGEKEKVVENILEITQAEDISKIPFLEEYKKSIKDIDTIICDVATSFNNGIVAFGRRGKENSGKVQIVDMAKNRIISEFKTIFCYVNCGVLAISESGNICICGSYDRYGVCGYDVKSGEKIWQRRDLKKVSRMQLVRSNSNFLFVSFREGSRASEIIEISTGKSVEKMIGVKSYFESKFSPLYILDTTKKLTVFDRNTKEKRFDIETHFSASDRSCRGDALLDISFTENSILVSETGLYETGLYCYDINTGKLLWHTEDKPFYRLAYNEEIQKYVGYTWDHKKSDIIKLKYINCENGKIENEKIIDTPNSFGYAARFGFDGKILITADKEIIDVKTGEKSSLV